MTVLVFDWPNSEERMFDIRLDIHVVHSASS